MEVPQEHEDGRRLMIGALLLRVIWALWVGKLWGYHDDGFYDDGVFLDMARSVLSPNVPTHPPGYPLFLAPFVAWGDIGVSAARWLQMLISAATSVLAYRLALSLRLSRRAALLTGALVAVNPMLVYFSVRMMSESLFAALLLGFLLAWVHAWGSGSAKAATLAGVLGGAASLTRGVMLPFGGVLALVALWRRREQARWAGLVAACGLAWAGLMAPWTARNWRLHQRFIPVSVQGGWNFWEGLSDDAAEVGRRPFEMAGEVRRLGLSGTIAIDAHFAAKAKAWILENPGAFARICALKALQFWRPAPLPPHSLLARLAAAACAVVLLSGAVLGLAFGAAAAPGAWFLLGWVGHLTLLHSLFASNMRYRLPLEPVLAVFAGAGLAALIERSARR